MFFELLEVMRSSAELNNRHPHQVIDMFLLVFEEQSRKKS